MSSTLESRQHLYLVHSFTDGTPNYLTLQLFQTMEFAQEYAALQASKGKRANVSALVVNTEQDMRALFLFEGVVRVQELVASEPKKEASKKRKTK